MFFKKYILPWCILFTLPLLGHAQQPVKDRATKKGAVEIASDSSVQKASYGNFKFKIITNPIADSVITSNDFTERHLYKDKGYLWPLGVQKIPVALRIEPLPYYIAQRRVLYGANLEKEKKGIPIQSKVNTDQDINTKSIKDRFGYTFETGAFYTINNSIPFWQKTNQFGAVPNNGNSLYFRQIIASKKDFNPGFFKFDYALDLMTIVGNDSRFILPEAYLKFQFGKIALKGGRIKSNFGLTDTTYSSGSMTWSGNALPLPEVRIEIAEYQKLFVRWLGYKGHFTHGWFGNQTYVRDYYLHQKSLYGRIGSNSSRLHLYAGVLHNVQWGGNPKIPLTDPEFTSTQGKYPSDWFTYRNVVLPLATLSDTTLGYSDFEIENRFGNHISQVDFGFDYAFKQYKMLVYKNNIIETGRTIGSFSNLDDGLYGFSLKALNHQSVFQNFVLEYLFTKNQGSYNALISRLLKKPRKDYGNVAFYFNHRQYFDGWSYNDATIGTPFMLPNKDLVIYNEYGANVFNNANRLRVVYLSTAFKISKMFIETRASYSKNYGSFWFPVNSLNQVNTNFKFSYPLKTKQTTLQIQVGIDHGEYIRDNYGFNLAYKRAW